ncbi:PepSY-associated TM helix domain-containing protein [Sphingobacterium sp. LRF_L2]|uniref:PepSY-associated TM helix domain-containing protein n=1 Tax=Sphingobacterium sp. LRF_L2 TaxID=3369421 RepID=UPI003F6267C9
MKKIWRNVHLYLSLAISLFFFVECLTGCILVFEEEITEMLYRERFYKKSEDAVRLPADELIKSVSDQLSSGEEVAGLTFYADNRRTAEMSVKKRPDKMNRKEGNSNGKSRNKAAIGGNFRREPQDIVYVDPSTGLVTARVDPTKETFFKSVLKIHQNLLLDSLGKTLLGISTFVVFFTLLTGMILWWPKNRIILKQRLQVKTSGSWKRINHDLHVVLGFYCSFFLLIFLVTSLPWSFKWANEALYTLTGSKPPKSVPLHVEQIASRHMISWEQAFVQACYHLPDAPYWRISMPKKESVEGIQVSSANTKVLHRNGFDQLVLDPYTGNVLQITRHETSPAGWQLRRYMKPVHTGAIGGLSTKLVAFFVCLLSASFPITGIFLWWNRIKKKVKKKKKMNTLERV